MSDQPNPPAKTQEVFEYLRKCASDMRTVTYKELGDKVGLPAVGTAKPLGYILDHICIPRKLPLLTFIAVQSRSRRPGKGFLPDGLIVDMDEDLIWRAMVLQVFGYDWSSVDFEA